MYGRLAKSFVIPVLIILGGCGGGGAGGGGVITDPTGGFADSGTYLRDIQVTNDSELQAALNSALPGDKISIASGTYSGGLYHSGVTGTAQNPIMVAGNPGGGTIISGGNNCLHLVEPEYIVIQDLELTASNYNGINIDDGGTFDTPTHHVVIRRINVHDIGSDGNQDGIKLSGLDYFLIEDCEISSCGGNSSGSGIDMVGCHHGVIRGNYIHDTSGNAIQAKGGSEDVLIWRNLFVTAGERGLNLGGSTGLAFFRPQGADYEARNLSAIANVFVSCKAPIAFVGCDGALAANNTIYLPQNWVMRILQESVDGFIPCRNGRFINNIVVFNDADISTYVNIGPNTQPATFTFSNNLWHCLDNPLFTGPTLPVQETNGIYQQDPLFQDAPQRDFHIPTGSPAGSAGITLPEVPADYDERPYLVPPATGAFEISP